jgi:hypothetical protein
MVGLPLDDAGIGAQVRRQRQNWSVDVGRLRERAAEHRENAEGKQRNAFHEVLLLGRLDAARTNRG